MMCAVIFRVLILKNKYWEYITDKIKIILQYALCSDSSLLQFWRLLFLTNYVYGLELMC